MLFLKYWKHAAKITIHFKLGHKRQREPQCGRCDTNTDDRCISRQNRLYLDFTAWVEPQVQPLNTQISKQQKTQCEKLDLFTPVWMPARASTVFLRVQHCESRLWAWSFTAGGVLNKCVHTCTQLWEGKSSCWANLWRPSCTKSSCLSILWISLVSNMKPQPGSHFTNNPINSS